MARRRRSASTDTSWLSTSEHQADPVLVPRRDSPDQLRRERRWRWVRRLVVVTLVLQPLLLLTLAMVLYNAYLKPAPAPSVDISVNDSRAAATVAVEKWLAGEPAPLPGGSILSWDGSRVSYDPSATPRPGQSDEKPKLEIHRFTLQDTTARLFRSEVVVATTAANGPQTISNPSLLAVAPSADDLRDTSPWPTLGLSGTTPAIDTAVRVWAEAYLSGDPDRLRQAVADPTAGHSYMPLSGAKLESVHVQKAAAIWGDGSRRASTPDNPAPTMAVNVRLTLSWDGQPTPSPGTVSGGTSGGSSSDLPTIDMDLRVERTNSATPVVVAWGGTGTGADLVAYGNALTGRVVKAQPTPSRSATPTPATSTPAAASTPAAPGGTSTPSTTRTPSPRPTR